LEISAWARKWHVEATRWAVTVAVAIPFAPTVEMNMCVTSVLTAVLPIPVPPTSPGPWET
jgi:hypothetical protein